MSIDTVRKLCLSMPDSTENVQWGSDLVFKVAGKMFAVAALEPAKYVLSFKAADEEFAELVERPGVAPAPYLARAKWVALETFGAISRKELDGLLRKSYELVVARLPKKDREAVQAARTRGTASKTKAK